MDVVSSSGPPKPGRAWIVKMVRLCRALRRMGGRGADIPAPPVPAHQPGPMLAGWPQLWASRPRRAAMQPRARAGGPCVRRQVTGARREAHARKGRRGPQRHPPGNIS
jgi:hypothetical protein